jgi:glucan biosynthesis protein C
MHPNARVRNAPPASTDRTDPRYHGLDGLRAIAMLLGIVIHASIPYFLPKGNPVWPVDDEQSTLLWIVFESIHVWRMPVFFLLAGFFTHLLLERRTTKAFIQNRVRRIAIPLIIFWPVMLAIIPAVWLYGWTAELVLPGGQVSQADTTTSPPLFHLWFLYFLLIQYTGLLGCRSLASRLAFPRPLGIFVSRFTFTRIPVLLMVAAAAVLITGPGEETYVWWPINWSHFLYYSLFFMFGYGLHGRPAVLEQFKTTLVIGSLLAFGGLCFFIHLTFTILEFDAGSRGATSLAPLFGSIKGLATGLTATCWTISLVAMAERLLKTPNAVVRRLVDSSYWIYVMHLPVVAFFTFWLAHLDRQGHLREVTHIEWGANLKFLVATVLTLVIGLATYQYLVRRTPISSLLNGRRPYPQPRAKELP